jgi:two-component system phosphate regulon response regulator PhoB
LLNDLPISNPSILVADDEPDVRNLLGVNLASAGYQVLNAEDGSTTLAKARSHAPALIVLDVMMPGMSGMEVCRVLKGDPMTAGISIILLTAKAEEVDRILGLELGADDYVTKPFSPRELILRIQSILRRKGAAAPRAARWTVGEIALDLERHLTTVAGRPVDLTVIEFKLLSALMERHGRVHSRDELLNQVWGYEKTMETRTVDTHMRRLRDKLGAAAEQIQTVRGFGYRIDG